MNLIIRTWLRLYVPLLVFGVVVLIITKGIGQHLYSREIVFYNYNGIKDLFSYDLDRGFVGRLTSDGFAAHDENPVWSPDGRWIAFNSDRNPERIMSLYVMDADGHQLRRLTWDRHSYAPAWSPDGRQLAFHAQSSFPPAGFYNIDLFIVDVDGSNLRQITFTRMFEYNPVWSPDGNALVFQANYSRESMACFRGWCYSLQPSGYSYSLFRYDLHTRRLTPLTTSDQIDFDAAYSPDGTQIAFFSTLKKIHVMPAAGQRAGTPRQISGGAAPYGYDGSPAWSPDGVWIAFDTDRHASPRGSTGYGWMIYLVHPDGSDEHLLISGIRPSWRP